MRVRAHPREIVDYILIAAGIGLMIVGVTGEFVGWWGEAGLVITSLGAGLGILGAADVNGFRLLRRFGRQEALLVEANGKLDRLEKLEKLDKLDDVVRILDERLPHT